VESLRPRRSRSITSGRRSGRSGARDGSCGCAGRRTSESRQPERERIVAAQVRRRSGWEDITCTPWCPAGRHEIAVDLAVVELRVAPDTAPRRLQGRGKVVFSCRQSRDLLSGPAAGRPGWWWVGAVARGASSGGWRSASALGRSSRAMQEARWGRGRAGARRGGRVDVSARRFQGRDPCRRKTAGRRRRRSDR